MMRIVAAGLFLALAFLQVGCGCCHRQTARPAGPPCCIQGGVPPGTVIPAPPPTVANFPSPNGLPATYVR